MATLALFCRSRTGGAGTHFAVRYGHFVAPDQALEGALHKVSQLIDAIVELESMENERSRVPQGELSELYWQALSIDR